ncbi:MAG: hypothetical protein KH811_00625 [Veillonella sp.]|nr:hypothetical protein [Veillonella sp.]
MKNHVHKEAPPGMKHHRNYGKYLYTTFLVFTLIACNVQPVMAATIWDKASEIMKNVYNQIILISTIAAVVTASIALLLMNFSKIYRNMNYTSKIVYNSHLYSVYFNIL